MTAHSAAPEETLPAKVFVVDDDAPFRRLVSATAVSARLPVEAFDCARGFLDCFDHAGPGCLVLDFCMPGVSGLDLLKVLRQRGCQLPVVFVTARADVPLAVEVMKLGAFEFLQKPCQPPELLRAIQAAIGKSQATWCDSRQRAAGRQRLEQLSPRERQVADLLAAGVGTKSAARRLGLSPKTVEFHRTRLYRKLEVTNVVELVRALQTAGEVPADCDPALAEAR